MSRNTLSQCNSSGRDLQECLSCNKKSGGAAVYTNLALALFKAMIGFVGGSSAMLGDALFSFKNFIASLIVVFGIKVSGKPADEQHPYGHGKLEFVALFLISIGLIVPILFLIVHTAKGFWHCFHNNVDVPKLVVFWAAIISVVANHSLAQFLRCVGDNQHSPSMLANARNNHMNANASIIVAVAILGARYLGLVFLDSLVAFVGSVHLLVMSISMLMEALKGLFDSAAPVAAAEKIESIARLVPGVRKVSKVVARHQGQGLWVDMTIKIDHAMAHQEGYLISRHVKESIQAALGNHTIVNVVFEPYMP